MKRIAFLLIAIFLLISGSALVYYYVHWSDQSISRDILTAIPPITAAMLFLTLAMASFALWLGALIHLLKNNSILGTDRILWLLVIIFLYTLGAVLYFLIAPRPSLRRPIRL
ncbi:MAG: PLDc N-terminal domain-containing protein [Chthoniobacterales bacterium]